MKNQKLQVTILGNIHTNNSDRVIPFADYIESIKDGSIDALTGKPVAKITADAQAAYAACVAENIDPKKAASYNDIKIQLPVITAGDASAGVAREKIKSCGLHIADLDGSSESPFTPADKAALKRALLALDYVIAVVESCSGNGFALYYLSDLTDADKPDYKSLQEAFFCYINQSVLTLGINTPALRHLGLCLDAGAKDVFSRRRFISADADVAVAVKDVTKMTAEVCPLTKATVAATSITAVIGNKKDTDRAKAVLFELDSNGQLKYPPAVQGAGGQPAQTAAIGALRRAGFSKAMARGYYLLFYNPSCVPPFSEQDDNPDSKRFNEVWDFVNNDKPYAAQAIRRIIKVKQVNSPPPAPAPVPATDAKSTYTCGVKALDELLTKIEPVDWSKHTKTGSDGKVSPPNQKVYKLRAIDAVKAAARVAGTAFCNYADNTTIYNGKCYVDIDCKALPQFLKYAAYQADVPADIARDEPFLDKLVKQFYLDSGENIVAAPPESYINLNNGTMIFNQNGRSFEPHSPHRFIRYALDFDYEPDAKCDRWQEHLDRCLPDKEQQRYLSKLLALPFYQRKVETLVVLYGQPMTGKSVTLDVYRALLGRQNVVSETLAAVTRSGENYRTANLDGKLACISTDINDKVGDDGVCKILASREPYSVRRAYGQPFEMQNYARLFFAANTIPAAFLKSPAMLRRLSLLEFKVAVKESEKRLNFVDSIIKSELGGVLNWILDGLQELVQAGDGCNPLIPPESVKEDLQRIRIEGDAMTGWADALRHGERDGLGFIVRGGTMYFPEYIELSALHKDYWEWCGGKDVPESGGFAIKLREHGFNVLKRENGKRGGAK